MSPHVRQIFLWYFCCIIFELSRQPPSLWLSGMISLQIRTWHQELGWVECAIIVRWRPSSSWCHWSLLWALKWHLHRVLPEMAQIFWLRRLRQTLYFSSTIVSSRSALPLLVPKITRLPMYYHLIWRQLSVYCDLHDLLNPPTQRKNYPNQMFVSIY